MSNSARWLLVLLPALLVRPFSSFPIIANTLRQQSRRHCETFIAINAGELLLCCGTFDVTIALSAWRYCWRSFPMLGCSSVGDWGRSDGWRSSGLACFFSQPPRHSFSFHLFSLMWWCFSSSNIELIITSCWSVNRRTCWPHPPTSNSQHQPGPHFQHM